jgi:hypothetical protein
MKRLFMINARLIFFNLNHLSFGTFRLDANAQSVKVVEIISTFSSSNSLTYIYYIIIC